MHPSWRTALTATLLLVLSTLVQALPNDHQQAIEIQAQSAVREEKKGLTIYQGNVSIKQGSIWIRADKVTVINNNNKVEKIICIGQPAHYEQQPKQNGGLVIAKANTIEYQLATDLVYLIGNASLEQEGATLTGERIDYNLKEEIIKARGDSNGNQRIRMVIPPSQLKESN